MQKILIALVALTFAVACQTKPVNKSGANAHDGRVAHPHEHAHDNSISAGTQADLETNVGDTVYFTFDSSSLNTESQAVLTRQAAWMKANSDVSITVSGHCDLRGTREYNLGLGERRANATKNFLVSAGIDASRVTVISYGKERPVELGDSEEIYAKNRRSVTSVN